MGGLLARREPAPRTPGRSRPLALELAPQAEDDPGQRLDVGEGRPEVDDAGAEEEVSPHDRVRDVGLPSLLEPCEELGVELVELLPALGPSAREARGDVAERGDAEVARAGLELG